MDVDPHAVEANRTSGPERAESHDRPHDEVRRAAILHVRRVDGTPGVTTIKLDSSSQGELELAMRDRQSVLFAMSRWLGSSGATRIRM